MMNVEMELSLLQIHHYDIVWVLFSLPRGSRQGSFTNHAFSFTRVGEEEQCWPLMKYWLD